MRSTNNPDGQKRRSVIEDVRRAQIIDGAIETLAEQGYAGTSLARIAERIGVSKGVISYHFAGKDDLIERLVDHVYVRISEFVTPRVLQESTAVARLGARIKAVAEYARIHRLEMVALTEIFNNLRDADGRLRYGDAFNEEIYSRQEEAFRAGQASGELRPFDPRVMAVTVQAAIDAMIAYADTYPEHDLEHHAAELAELFEYAISAQPPTQRTGT